MAHLFNPMAAFEIDTFFLDSAPQFSNKIVWSVSGNWFAQILKLVSEAFSAVDFERHFDFAVVLKSDGRAIIKLV
jgi:hypothetical protein